MIALRFRIVAAASLSLAMAGCAGLSPSGGGPAVEGGRIETPAQPLQCVPYARARSGLAIYGDASTWWGQAAGRYARSHYPAKGAVLVLDGYAGPDRAHLAVVRSIVSPRIIRVDQANWLNDGTIFLDDPVVDMSPDNDWSSVRVFNLRTGLWGTHDYLVQGFIGPGPAPPDQHLAEPAAPLISLLSQ